MHWPIWGSDKRSFGVAEPEFFSQVLEGYGTLWKRQPERIHRINSNGDKDAVFRPVALSVYSGSSPEVDQSFRPDRLEERQGDIMKLVIAILQDTDAVHAVAELNRRGFRATKLASTGGFLREGNTTILAGVEEKDVELVLAIVRRTSSVREDTFTPQTPNQTGEPYVPFPVNVTVGGATVFVVDIDRYEKY
jgi:uncharacterized protein YaaQ